MTCVDDGVNSLSPEKLQAERLLEVCDHTLEGSGKWWEEVTVRMSPNKNMMTNEEAEDLLMQLAGPMQGMEKQETLYIGIWN